MKSKYNSGKRQPYVGEAAFSHKAGQHADVIEKASELMEHIDSKMVGNTRHILLSELSGKSTIVNKLKKYGDFDKSSPEVKKLINVLKEKKNPDMNMKQQKHLLISL